MGRLRNSRAFNDAADPFVSACAHAGIPHRFLAQKGLYAKPIIIDLISYFAVLENAHDSPALYRVLTWPLWNVSHAALVELTHAAHKKGCSLWKICVEIDLVPDIEANDRERIRGIVGILQRHGSVSRSAASIAISHDSERHRTACVAREWRDDRNSRKSAIYQ